MRWWTITRLLQTRTKTEAKDENEQAHHDNRHRWRQPRGTSDMRQRGTIAENRLFRRDRWRGAEIVCERRRCVAYRERRQQQGPGRRWAAVEAGPDRRRDRRQGARALWRSLRRIPRPRSGLCVLSVRGRQGRQRFPRWGNLSALRRHFRAHRSGRRDLVQPQAKRRLSDRARKSPRKQSRAVEIRESQAVLDEMDSQH